MIEYLLVGIMAGVSLGALGTAWGAITVPFLLILGIEPMTAKASVLSSEIVVSSCGALSHRKLNNIKRELSFALLLGVVGALFGSYLSKGLSISNFRVIIGMYEILAGIALITIKPKELINVENNRGFHWAVLIGLLAGFVKGFLGTGWGPVGVTLLVLFGALPKKVVGSSLLARVTISGSAVIYYFLNGYVSLNIMIWLILGGIIGVITGSYGTKRIKEDHMRLLIGVFILLLGINVFIETF